MGSNLHLEQISVTLGGHRILSDLSLHVRPHEFTALLGVSGSGKSTLLKTIVGEVKEDRGEIRGAHRYGYAPQRAPLLPWLTVQENLCLAKPRSESMVDYTRRVRDLLSRAGLENAQDLRPATLSGGMRGRVNILRAFLTSSEILLMDEPFIGLDVVTRERLHELTVRLWQEHAKPATVFVTHDLDEALRLANRILVLKKDGSGFAFDVLANASLGTSTSTASHFPVDSWPQLKAQIFEALK